MKEAMGRYTGKKCRLITMLSMTSLFFLIEILVGYGTNSMALIADSFHMLNDVTALVITMLSIKMAPKKWSKNTYGFARAEVLGALINAVFLAALCFSITVEAIKRFIEAEEISEPKLILVVGAIGLVVNILGMCLFHEHGGHSNNSKKVTFSSAVSNLEDDEAQNSFIKSENIMMTTNDSNNLRSSSNLNMRGIFLHVMADALGSVVVVISALVVWLTEWEYKFYLDPALSLMLVFIIAHSLWPLLRDSSLILLQTVPTNMKLEVIQENLAKVDGVLSIHEFHLWQLTDERIIASVHIRCRDISEFMTTAQNVTTFFHNEGVHSVTIQPEFNDLTKAMTHETSVNECLLRCPNTGVSCTQATCCGPVTSETNGEVKSLTVVR
ncbi:zinc/cadmium resistance protein-like isoform X2 [Cimex lectularius]|nr:zinc/cadmium resistance protein-like isoform X2 [Cimex lectularius]XP_014250401.1 zinc/cadmium resistance protein-like isoform X2 [Cimex lectularius]XP_014250402.1 zinc/cadmium resistance protein-like isoform X2 [Cimex lectularius]XP_014250403.1 zinc/cadmium resistance protein-like isoform X2 [Cimex lectularius]